MPAETFSPVQEVFSCNRTSPGYLPRESSAIVLICSRGGSDVSAQEIIVGGTVAKPVDPSYAGNNFVHRYRDTEWKTGWDFDDTWSIDTLNSGYP